MIPAPLVTFLGRNATTHWLAHASAGAAATAVVVVAGSLGPAPAVATDLAAVPTGPSAVTVAPPEGEEVVTGDNARFGAAMLLQDGLARLERVDGYAATLVRREAIRGELRPAETVAVKIRHAPFGVYMKWLDGRAGQELLYVEGENEGKMLVRPGGWRGRLLGTLKLDPTGDLATADSRHSVVEAGLRNLAAKVLGSLMDDDRARSARYVLRTAAADGEPAYRLTIDATRPAEDRPFRRSEVVIDAATMLPTRVLNYGWPVADANLDDERLAEATLLEDYHYVDVDLDAPVTLATFDARNPDYRLSRR